MPSSSESTLSSGTVLLVLFEPENFREGNLRLISSFAKTNLKNGTLSVVNARLSDPDEILNMVINPRTENTKFTYQGVASAEVSCINSIKDSEENQVFEVVKHPLDKFISHAHLGVSSKLRCTPKYWSQKNLFTAAVANLSRCFSKCSDPKLECCFD